MAVLVEGRVSRVIIVAAGRVLVADCEGLLVIVVQVVHIICVVLVRVDIVYTMCIIAPTGRGLGAFGARFAGDTLGRPFFVAATATTATPPTSFALALLARC